MARVCDGKSLPRAIRARSICCGSSATRAIEIFDVTDPAKPLLLWQRPGLKDTHKSFWECDTGIAYLVSGVPGWRVRAHDQDLRPAIPPIP